MESRLMYKTQVVLETAQLFSIQIQEKHVGLQQPSGAEGEARSSELPCAKPRLPAIPKRH